MLFYNEKIFKRCFSFRARYWYKNLRYIPLYFKQLHFLIKNGYDVSATWAVDEWFFENISKILNKFEKQTIGIPLKVEGIQLDEERNNEDIINEKWHEILKLMANDAEFVHKNYWDLNDIIAPVQERFFKYFTKYINHLWD